MQVLVDWAWETGFAENRRFKKFWASSKTIKYLGTCILMSFFYRRYTNGVFELAPWKMELLVVYTMTEVSIALIQPSLSQNHTQVRISTSVMSRLQYVLMNWQMNCLGYPWIYISISTSEGLMQRCARWRSQIPTSPTTAPNLEMPIRKKNIYLKVMTTVVLTATNFFIREQKVTNRR